MKRVFTTIVVILVFSILATPAHAGRRQEVLGTATPASEVNFPPITSGPGHFLPDNPFFPLDQAFQAIRLAFQTDPLARARVHSSIAGERLAELRIMFEKGDEEGIDTTLRLLTKEMNQAALKLSEAKARGVDNEEIQKLAGELNEQLKEQRQIIGSLEDQTQSSLRLKLTTARQQLREAKLTVEDSLPQETLEREIQAGLDEDIDSNSEAARLNVEKLRSDLEILRLHLEDSQIRNLASREAALRQAIENKEQQLVTRGARFEEIEERQREAEVQEAVEAAEEAQKHLDEIRRVVEEAQNIDKNSR